jgi:hypothetical protein
VLERLWILDPVPAWQPTRRHLSRPSESRVTLCVRVYAQHAEARIGHLRTYAGDHEVDLIVQRQDGR